MSIERAREALRAFGAEGRIVEFGVSTATVPLAAAALGVEEARIAKTLSFAAPGGVVLLVAAGDARFDRKLFRAKFGCRPKMLAPEDAPGLVGHAVGGVCPFGVREGVAVWLDESLRRFPTVFPACGSPNSAIEVTPAELEEFSGAAGWADVCSGWRESPRKVS